MKLFTTPTESNNNITKIGNCTLYNADCFDIFPLIPNNSIDAIICDLPYGTTQAKWDSVLPLDKLWAEYKRIIKPNGAIVLTASQPFTTRLISSNYEMFRYELIWEKSRASGFLSAKKQPLRAHENILVFSKKSTTYNPQKTQSNPYNRGTYKNLSREKADVYGNIPNYHPHVVKSEDGSRFPRSVQYFVTPKPKEQFHPTQKPVALMEYLVKTYTNTGDTVLDNTMGSGTTGVSCMLNNRAFIGIEKEQEYFDIAVKRIAESGW